MADPTRNRVAGIRRVVFLPVSRTASTCERDPESITTGECLAKARAAARRNDFSLWAWVPASRARLRAKRGRQRYSCLTDSIGTHREFRPPLPRCAHAGRGEELAPYTDDFGSGSTGSWVRSWSATPPRCARRRSASPPASSARSGPPLAYPADRFHAIALNGAARRDVDVERGLADRFRIEPPYLSLAAASTLLSSTQVWLKPIEQCGGTSCSPVLAL